jgi:hypothetical protein
MALVKMSVDKGVLKTLLYQRQGNQGKSPLIQITVLFPPPRPYADVPALPLVKPLPSLLVVFDGVHLLTS